MSTSPFYYQKVTDIDELRRFVRNYFKVSGNELPESFVKKAIVYQFYEGPKAVAGFILNVAEMNSLRTLSYLDEKYLKRMLSNEDLSDKQMLEISANYKLEDELTDGQALIYYRVMLAQAYLYARKLNKTYIVAGSVIKELQKIHQTLLQRVIHSGPIGEEHLKKVKDGEIPVFKIYVAEVDDFPFRAVMALMNRYVIRAIKNRFKRAFLRKPEKQPPTEDADYEDAQLMA